MWRRVGLVRTDVSEERIASIFRIEGIRENASSIKQLAAANGPPSSPILSILKMEATCSSETSALTIPTLHHVPDEDNLHNHRCKNLKS
jgi:hypothetical protein